jgi:hypothetical protein
MSRFSVWLWHPFLGAALPVLEFYRVNSGSSHVRDVLALSLAYALVTGLLVVVLRPALGSTRRAALASTAFAFVLLRGGAWSPAVWVACGATATLVSIALRFASDTSLRRPTLVANLVLVALAGLAVARTIRAQARLQSPHPRADFNAPIPLSGDVRPDVYFIVADGLGDPGILERRYGVPQETLREPFERLGFRFVEASRSNYSQTALSLASTLNFDYVQNLLEIPDAQVLDRRPLGRLISDNRLVRTLRGAGYRIATIPSGYELARFDRVDVRLQPTWRLGFFALHNLRTTMLPQVQRLAGRGPGDLGFELHRHRLRTALRHLRSVRHEVVADEPLFVFAHLIAPHPPFVFDAHGKPLRSHQRFAFRDGDHWLLEKPKGAPGYHELYAKQARYIVGELTRALSDVLDNASRPTLVVVQGDHGPGGALVWDVPGKTDPAERHGIFNAWFVPAEYDLELTAGMTAVNTFRVLLAVSLGAPLQRLDDRAWHTRWIRPYACLELGASVQASELPKALVDDDAAGDRQVEAARLVPHRDAEAMLGKAFQ